MVDRLIGIYVVTFCILALDADEAGAFFYMRGCQDCRYSELIFFSCLHRYHILNFVVFPCISITFWDASVHHETRNCQTICSWKIQITNHEFSCFLACIYITFWIAVRLVARLLTSWIWTRGNLVRLWLVCDLASCFAASDLVTLLLRLTTVAASWRVL